MFKKCCFRSITFDALFANWSNSTTSGYETPFSQIAQKKSEPYINLIQFPIDFQIKPINSSEFHS